MSARFIVADVFDGLASLEPGSVDLVLSSPPFLALRSYLPQTHPTKGKEIGSEATPADFLDTLLDVVEACDRVLAPHGSLVFELGDTYAGSGGAGGDYNAGGQRDGQERFDGSARRQRFQSGNGWPLHKSLTGIPTLFAWSLAYGRNLLRPERETEPWRIRNVVAWCRPNPTVGALGDKFRPATSYLTIATKARARYFDLDAVRNPESDMAPGGSANSRQASGDDRGQGELSRRAAKAPVPNPSGAPPLDWWEIPTQPYKGSHYATWPEALLVKPILAMCPPKVCRVCGEPSRRIVGDAEYVPSATYRGGSSFAESERVAEGVNQWIGDNGAKASVVRTAPTLGWTDCGHNAWRTGVVLDPFAGSGTTLAVAQSNGRDSIGIDLDSRNADLARERVGMFLTGENLEPADA